MHFCSQKYSLTKSFRQGGWETEHTSDHSLVIHGRWLQRTFERRFSIMGALKILAWRLNAGWSIFSRTKRASDSGTPSRGPVQLETPFCLTVNSWWKLRGIAGIAILQFYFGVRKFGNGNSSTQLMTYTVFFSNLIQRLEYAILPPRRITP